MAGRDGAGADERACGKVVDEDGVDTGDEEEGESSPGERDGDGGGTGGTIAFPIIRPANNSSPPSHIWSRTFPSRSSAWRPPRYSRRFPNSSSAPVPMRAAIPLQSLLLFVPLSVDQSDPAGLLFRTPADYGSRRHLTAGYCLQRIVSGPV